MNTWWYTVIICCFPEWQTETSRTMRLGLHQRIFFLLRSPSSTMRSDSFCPNWSFESPSAKGRTPNPSVAKNTSALNFASSGFGWLFEGVELELTDCTLLAPLAWACDKNSCSFSTKLSFEEALPKCGKQALISDSKVLPLQGPSLCWDLSGLYCGRVRLSSLWRQNVASGWSMVPLFCGEAPVSLVASTSTSNQIQFILPNWRLKAIGWLWLWLLLAA